MPHLPSIHHSPDRNILGVEEMITMRSRSVRTVGDLIEFMRQFVILRSIIAIFLVCKYTIFTPKSVIKYKITKMKTNKHFLTLATCASILLFSCTKEKQPDGITYQLNSSAVSAIISGSTVKPGDSLKGIFIFLVRRLSVKSRTTGRYRQGPSRVTLTKDVPSMRHRPPVQPNQRVPSLSSKML